MSGLTLADAMSWHSYAETWLRDRGINALSPMRMNDFLRGDKPIEANGDYHAVYTTDAGIMTRDFNDVARCDAVLMYLLHSTRVSIGCMLEAGWAYALRKPLVLVIEDSKMNVHEHPILRASTGYRVPALIDGLEAVHYLLG